MIRNNLAVLLAERSLKITQVAQDTGISRNTITSTAQNDGKMIQLETINILCQYLGISHSEFFSYLPFDVKVATLSPKEKITKFEKSGRPDDEIHINEYSFDLFLTETNVKSREKKTHSLIVNVPNFTVDTDKILNLKTVFPLDTRDSSIIELSRLWDELPAGFKGDIRQNILNSIGLQIEKDIMPIDDNIRYMQKRIELTFEDKLL